jgi:hypothetical protein
LCWGLEDPEDVCDDFADGELPLPVQQKICGGDADMKVVKLETGIVHFGDTAENGGYYCAGYYGEWGC